MALDNLRDAVNQAISDFDGIKEEIEANGVLVEDAPTMDYPEKIRDIPSTIRPRAIKNCVALEPINANNLVQVSLNGIRKWLKHEYSSEYQTSLSSSSDWSFTIQYTGTNWRKYTINEALQLMYIFRNQNTYHDENPDNTYTDFRALIIKCNGDVEEPNNYDVYEGKFRVPGTINGYTAPDQLNLISFSDEEQTELYVLVIPKNKFADYIYNAANERALYKLNKETLTYEKQYGLSYEDFSNNYYDMPTLFKQQVQQKLLEDNPYNVSTELNKIIMKPYTSFQNTYDKIEYNDTNKCIHYLATTSLDFINETDNHHYTKQYVIYYKFNIETLLYDEPVILYETDFLDYYYNSTSTMSNLYPNFDLHTKTCIFRSSININYNAFIDYTDTQEPFIKINLDDAVHPQYSNNADFYKDYILTNMSQTATYYNISDINNITKATINGTKVICSNNLPDNISYRGGNGTNAFFDSGRYYNTWRDYVGTTESGKTAYIYNYLIFDYNTQKYYIYFIDNEGYHSTSSFIWNSYWFRKYDSDINTIPMQMTWGNYFSGTPTLKTSAGVAKVLTFNQVELVRDISEAEHIGTINDDVDTGETSTVNVWTDIDYVEKEDL